MDGRWSVEVDDLWLALIRRRQHCKLHATTRTLGNGERELVELLCEGDQDVFNRRGYTDDAAVGALFVGVTDGLLRPATNRG